MKMKTAEAAKSLGIHPAQLFLCIAELDSSLTFSDVWPVIDTNWVEAVRVSKGYAHAAISAKIAGSPEIARPGLVPSLSENAIRILDKLYRKRKFGKASVTLEALKNLTHIPENDLDNAMAELRKGGFLDTEGRRPGVYSLHSAKTKEIVEIIKILGQDY